MNYINDKAFYMKKQVLGTGYWVLGAGCGCGCSHNLLLHYSLWVNQGQNKIHPWWFFIRKYQQRAVIKKLSFLVVAGLTAMYVFIGKSRHL